jgi:hypothetical protein
MPAFVFLQVNGVLLGRCARVWKQPDAVRRNVAEKLLKVGQRPFAGQSGCAGSGISDRS